MLKRFAWMRGAARRVLCAMMMAAVLAGAAAAADTSGGAQTDLLPVLMYHHLRDDPGTSQMIVSPGRFAEQMEALAKAGYTAVTPDDLIAFVDEGKPLPEKPVWITFDDGYQSNLDYGAPVLQKNKLKATIYVIGISVGKTTYKDMGVPIIPHFSFEDAQPWVDRDILTIQSHTYDMHNVSNLDAGHYRRGVLPRDGESLEAYMEAFRTDFAASADAIQKAYGKPVTAFAYPFGLHNAVTEGMLRQAGVRLTVTIREGLNTLTQGDPTCLYGMSRFNITDDVTGEQLLAKIAEP